MKLTNSTIKKTMNILEERNTVKENFSRMDALQGSNAMEKAFAAVDLNTLMSIALPYLNDDEKEILKDEMLKIVMVMPDAELEEIYDTVVASVKGVSERKEPEQLDELLGGLKRMFGKPGSPEDQAVLDYITDMPISTFPTLATIAKQLSKPNQIKRGIKGALDYRSQGESAALSDKRKVSVRNAEKFLPRIVQQLERLQSDAQGKMFKGTAGLMMRLIQGYRDTILGDEKERQRDSMDSASRTVSRQAAADRGSDRSLMNKRIRNL